MVEKKDFLLAVKIEKDKDSSSKKKRPAEEGASARPLPPNLEISAIMEIQFPMGYSPRWSNLADNFLIINA